MPNFDAESIEAASADSIKAGERVTVTGNVVPLPAGLPLLFSGLMAGVGFLRRRREADAA